jgi:hypothetical protein
MERYHVDAPPAHNRSGEVLGDAAHRVSHLRTAIMARISGGGGGAEHALFHCAGEAEANKEGRKKDADLVGHDGGVGVLDDRRQGAVVVQEHHDMLPLRRRERRLEPRQCRGVTLLRAIDRFQFRQLEQASAQRVQTKKRIYLSGARNTYHPVAVLQLGGAARRGGLHGLDPGGAGDDASGGKVHLHGGVLLAVARRR